MQKAYRLADHAVDGFHTWVGAAGTELQDLVHARLQEGAGSCQPLPRGHSPAEMLSFLLKIEQGPVRRGGKGSARAELLAPKKVKLPRRSAAAS